MTTLSRTRWVLAALGFSAALTLCFPAAAQLDAFHAQFWSQASFGFSAPEDYDNFGRALAAGDFDGDGFADLAIGTPREDVLVAIGYNIVDAGTVTVLYGTADGLSTTLAVSPRERAPKRPAQPTTQRPGLLRVRGDAGDAGCARRGARIQ